MTHEIHPHDQPPRCYEHVWVLRSLHLSLRSGAAVESECGRCGALIYDNLSSGPDFGRRSKLRPTQRLRDEP